MNIEDMPDRIGGKVLENREEKTLEIPYFSGLIHITKNTITDSSGKELNPWE